MGQLAWRIWKGAGKIALVARLKRQGKDESENPARIRTLRIFCFLAVFEALLVLTASYSIPDFAYARQLAS